MGARTVLRMNLDDTEALADGAKLHLERPAPVAVVHLEVLQRGEADGAEGREVLEAAPEEQPGGCEDEPVSPPGVRAQVAARSVRGYAHAEGEVGAPGEGGEEEGERGRIFGVVGVEERHRAGRGGGGGQLRDPCQAGRTVAAPGFPDDDRTGCARDGSRAVDGSVVGHDYAVQTLHGERREDRRQSVFLVERGDQDSGLAKQFLDGRGPLRGLSVHPPR